MSDANCLDSAAIVAELISNEAIPSWGLRILLSVNDSLSFLSPIGQGHAIILVEVEPSVASTSIGRGGAVTEGEYKNGP